MGMFDTVTVVNISNENFDENGLSFQTKCLENKLNEYIVFNNQLWMQYCGDESQRYDEAVPVDLTDTINIYTDHKTGDKVYWLEYNLKFQSGKLVDVEKIEERITKDLSDKSELRPQPKTKSACVTVDFRGVDNELYESFMAELDSNLEKIRGVVGDPMAEIVYQERTPENSMIFSSSSRWIHSFVQSFDSMKKENLTEGMRSTELNNGDKLHVIFDEGSYYINWLFAF